MSLMLVRVKCRLPRTAMVVVFSYLLVFVPKVISDIMRVAQIERSVTTRQISNIALALGDRTKDTILQIFVMAVDVIRIKVQSDSH